MKLSEAKQHDICRIIRIFDGATWVCQMVGTDSDSELPLWSDHIGLTRKGEVWDPCAYPEPFDTDGNDIDTEFKVEFICNALDLFKSAHPEVFI